MNEAQKRYVLLEQGGSSFVFNMLINGFIAWLMFRAKDEIPLLGSGTSIVFDSTLTLFLLGLLLTVIVTKLTRKAIAARPELHTANNRADDPWIRWLPESAFMRGVLLGLALVVLMVPLFLLFFSIAGIAAISSWSYIIFKGIYTGVAGGILAVIVVWAAVYDASEGASSD